MANTGSLHHVSDRFFSLPDVITTPQTLLLPWLGVPRFVLFDVILHYTIGVATLMALGRRFRWSLFTFAVVFLLFSFNGHILSHYSVGHFTWAAYFLFPLWFLLWFQFLDGQHGWRWLSRFAFVMFYMVLAGGQHQFTWALIFLACLIPFCLDRVGWIIAAGLASVFLSAVRLLPPALLLDAIGRAGWMIDVVGYPSGFHLIRAMVELRREDLDPLSSSLSSLPGNFVFFESHYHEFSYYVGVLGAAALLYFGLYRWLRTTELVYPQLMVPTLVLVALSMGSVFRIVRASGIPLFFSERILSRLLSLPMSLIMIMAGVFLQKTINQLRLSVWHRLVALSLLGLLAIDVSGEIRLMRLSESVKIMRPVPLDDSIGEVARRDDPAYTAILGAGALITSLTAAGLLVLATRERRSHGLVKGIP
jgi:hypothetical protein